MNKKITYLGSCGIATLIILSTVVIFGYSDNCDTIQSGSVIIYLGDPDEHSEDDKYIVSLPPYVICSDDPTPMTPEGSHAVLLECISDYEVLYFENYMELNYYSNMAYDEAKLNVFFAVSPEDYIVQSCPLQFISGEK